MPCHARRGDRDLPHTLDGWRAQLRWGLVVDHARLYNLSDEAIDIVAGVSGPASVALAVEAADGIVATEPNAELVEGFCKAKQGPTDAAAVLFYAESEQAGQEHWPVNSELRDVDGFESASRFVRAEDLADAIAVESDVEAHLAVIRRYVDAGFDHVMLICRGKEQSGSSKFSGRNFARVSSGALNQNGPHSSGRSLGSPIRTRYRRVGSSRRPLVRRKESS
jgi:hypothetical protein